FGGRCFQKAGVVRLCLQQSFLATAQTRVAGAGLCQVGETLLRTLPFQGGEENVIDVGTEIFHDTVSFHGPIHSGAFPHRLASGGNWFFTGFPGLPSRSEGMPLRKSNSDPRLRARYPSSGRLPGGTVQRSTAA